MNCALSLEASHEVRVLVDDGRCRVSKLVITVLDVLQDGVLVPLVKNKLGRKSTQ